MPGADKRRILVIDAYPRERRAILTDAGGTEAGTLYRNLLERIVPGIETSICHPADGELPDASELPSYDGATWTGSNLSILDADDPRVARQIDLARQLIDAEVPSFGSCFALHLASVALGGRCGASPKGLEFGISRKIELSAGGREHPLYREKPAVFDAFTSHADEVVALPQGSELLASNGWSKIQGASLRGGSFMAVQYHPEYDFHEVASLYRIRKPEFIQQGMFESAEAADRYIDDLEALHADATREDLMKSLGVDHTLTDASTRTLEVRNWLDAPSR